MADCWENRTRVNKICFADYLTRFLVLCWIPEPAWSGFWIAVKPVLGCFGGSIVVQISAFVAHLVLSFRPPA